jgi:hypothetical protein
VHISGRLRYHAIIREFPISVNSYLAKLGLLDLGYPGVSHEIESNCCCSPVSLELLSSTSGPEALISLCWSFDPLALGLLLTNKSLSFVFRHQFKPPKGQIGIMKLESFSPSISARPKSTGITRWFTFVLGIFVLSSFYRYRSTVQGENVPSTFNLRQILLSVPSHEHARNWSAYYTSETHLAGQGLEQARWTQAKWKEFGIKNTTISSHDTRLPMPKSNQRLALIENSQVLYEAPLTDTNRSANFIPAYFGFSANANVSGSYVFCNFGSPEDFEDLVQRNVSLLGNIAIIKLGTATPYVHEKNLSMFRALSVHNAERAGMIGVVLYTDPGNDGPTTEGNGYKPFPAGTARPLEAIERGGFGSIGT